MTKKTATKNATPNIIPLTFLPPELKALDKGVRVFLFLTEHKGKKLPDIKAGDVIENRRGKRRLEVTAISRPLTVLNVPLTMRERVTPTGCSFADFVTSMDVYAWHTVRAITVRVITPSAAQMTVAGIGAVTAPNCWAWSRTLLL